MEENQTYFLRDRKRSSNPNPDVGHDPTVVLNINILGTVNLMIQKLGYHRSISQLLSVLSQFRSRLFHRNPPPRSRGSLRASGIHARSKVSSPAMFSIGWWIAHTLL